MIYDIYIPDIENKLVASSREGERQHSKLLFVNMLSFIFLFQTFAYRSSFENLFVCVVREFVCVNSDVFMTKKMFSKTYVLYKIVI